MKFNLDKKPKSPEKPADKNSVVKPGDKVLSKEGLNTLFNKNKSSTNLKDLFK